jgi:hypothetical protein
MRCRDVFPCKGVCDHIDCIFRRVELGTLERPHAIGGITVTERHGPAEIVVLDTTSDDPLEWVWPGDWS